MLELINLSKTFESGLWRTPAKFVVKNVSLKLRKGEILGLIGASGCGKSTIARMAVKLLDPTTGGIRLDGEDVTAMSARRFRRYRHRIQIMFQHPEGALNPCYTLHQSINESFCRLGLPPDKRDAVLDSLLSEVGLSHKVLDRRPDQVSGGEIQRAVLARVLAFGPDYLLLDEPTSMLDLSVQAHILRLLEKKSARDNMGLLFISHDLEVVRAICDRVLVLKQGGIVEQGPVEQIFEHPAHPYTAQLVEACQGPKSGVAISNIKGAPQP